MTGPDDQPRREDPAAGPQHETEQSSPEGRGERSGDISGPGSSETDRPGTSRDRQTGRAGPDTSSTGDNPRGSGAPTGGPRGSGESGNGGDTRPGSVSDPTGDSSSPDSPTDPAHATGADAPRPSDPETDTGTGGETAGENGLPDGGAPRRRVRAFDFGEYLRTETVGGLVLLAATALALIAANSPIGALYEGLRDFTIGPHALHLDLTVGEWAKDGLLAIFFFVAGLELKRELVVGELANIKSAILPVVAALGGMVVPAVLAYAVSHGSPGATEAWAIPVATDIAFALGVLSLTGSWMPTAARVFLLSLAVVDDLGAIIVIAVLFTDGLGLVALAAAVVLCAAYWFAQRKRITAPWLYVPLAVATWIAVHSSGIHATIAGVALGLLTRVKRDPDEEASPSMRLEHRLQPWSSGLVVPVFAFFAAGVPVNAEALGEVFHDRVSLAVMLGLFFGKFLGIFGVSFLAVRLGMAAKPTGVAWRDLAALAVLGGVGFTVSLLIAELSLSGSAAERAKAAVLIASALASLVASAMLVRRGRRVQLNGAEITRE